MLPDNKAFIRSCEADAECNEATIVSYAGSKKNNVVISSDFDSIGDYAFLGTGIYSVTIPNTIINIGIAAFNDNYLSDENAFLYQRNRSGVDNTVLVSYGGSKRDNIDIPSNVKTINKEAFIDNNITEINIPSTVENIYMEAFCNNKISRITFNGPINREKSNGYYNPILDTDYLYNIVNKSGIALDFDKILTDYLSGDPIITGDYDDAIKITTEPLETIVSDIEYTYDYTTGLENVGSVIIPVKYKFKVFMYVGYDSLEININRNTILFDCCQLTTYGTIEIYDQNDNLLVTKYVSNQCGTQ